jgi:hypothetical protein
MTRESWCFWMILGAGLFIGSVMQQLIGLTIPIIGAAALLVSFVAIERIDRNAFFERFGIK